MSTSGFAPATGTSRDELRVRGEHRPEAAIAGRLRRARTPRAGAGQGCDRASSAYVGDDDRPGRVGRRVEQGPDRRERRRAAGRRGRRARRRRLGSSDRPNPTWTELDRPRSGVRVDDAPFAAPGDRGLDRGGVVAEDDDDVLEPGLGERVEDVLEDRPTAERREQLAATEPRRRSGREDDRPSSRHARIVTTVAGPSHPARRPAAAPVGGRPRTSAQAIASARSRIGAPEPP